MLGQPHVPGEGSSAINMVTVKQALKRSSVLVNAVRRIKEFKFKGGLVRTNHEVAERLSVFSTNSGGSLREKGELALQAAEQTLPLMAALVEKVSGAANAPISIDKVFPPGSAEAPTRALADLFDQHGSDKSSVHNYHRLYGPLLSWKRYDDLRLLEIGIGTNNIKMISNMGAAGKPGASLRAFRDFLPNAAIFGADIDRAVLFSEDRIRTFYLDQTRRESFDQLAVSLGSKPFDLVIDDGLHSPHANIATMMFAFEILKPSGVFIVEDIAPASIPVWQIIAAFLPVDFRPVLIQADRGLLFMAQKPLGTSAQNDEELTKP
jgi:SAM-dependent methyltransferase